MEKIKVASLLTGKLLIAYIYDDNVLLVPSGTVPDSDKEMVTDKEGFRYKRKIMPNTRNEMLFQFHKAPFQFHKI